MQTQTKCNNKQMFDNFEPFFKSQRLLGAEKARDLAPSAKARGFGAECSKMHKHLALSCLSLPNVCTCGVSVYVTLVRPRHVRLNKRLST